ncbi:MAG TPA: hypothetical protein VFA60_05635 [Terriglobales bacterium]|nr:hypothetical protein [Terriglobales bacterium]
MKRLLLAGATAVILSTALKAETLREILDQHNVPTNTRSADDLSRTVVNYATFDSDSNFAIAYYDSGSNLLKSPLRFERYDRVKREWRSTQLREARLFGHSARDWCLRPAMALDHYGAFWYVSVHINPSAGCLLVLDDQLRLHKTLYGWSVAGFDSGEVVLRHSQAHFAPTHPLELSVYDPRRDQVTKIYPVAGDPYRHAFAERIRPMLDQEWCRERNHHCDAELFDGDLREIVMNDRASALAFVVEADASSYGPKAAGIGKMNATYVYRLTPRGIEHISFPSGELKGRTGAGDMREVVSPAVIQRLFTPR